MSADSTIWVDGLAADGLPLPDRGLSFGDGLFETLLLHEGRPQFLDAHLARLRLGANVLGLPECIPEARKQIQTAAAHSSASRWSALRLTLTRGCGPRGYAPPREVRPRMIVEVSELPGDCASMASAAALGVAEHRFGTQASLAGIKHLNRLDQVLAARQMQALACDEGIMLDQEGRVVSVIAGNLFILRGDELITPPIDACGVCGTRRGMLIDQWAPQLQLPVREAPLSLEDVHGAPECFYTNALHGIRPIARVGETRWQAHPVAEALFAVYRGLLS